MNEHNPLNRKYTKEEVDAGVLVGVSRKEKKYNPWPQVEIVTSGQMIYATGSYWPVHARQMAEAWSIVADAMEREWSQNNA